MCTSTEATATATTTATTTSQTKNDSNCEGSSLGSGEKLMDSPSASGSSVLAVPPPPPPSIVARYTCASVMMAFFAVWGKYTFVAGGGDGNDAELPVGDNMHSWKVTLVLTTGYIVSLPLLRMYSSRYLSKQVDTKLLLKESMVLYNAGQVVLNGWMVYRFLYALLCGGHPFIGAPIDLVGTGATYAVWVHYCDKYLEFFDTFFMVLRGRMDQVSFLHVYHHMSIAWAWWAGIRLFPGGDNYFGAMLNSWIHVMMYSYYALSLLRVPCPWKRYLTQAQLVQFVTVIAYTVCSIASMPHEARWNHYTAYGLQVFEMSSLFVLFMFFYRKAYKNKSKNKKVSTTATSANENIKSEATTTKQQQSGATTTTTRPHNSAKTTAITTTKTDSNSGGDNSGTDVPTEQESISSASSEEDRSD